MIGRSIEIMVRAAALVSVLLATAVDVRAERPGPEEKTIHIIGREQATVTKGDLTLADIAEVFSKHVEDDEAIVAMKKIAIGESPDPGRERSFGAQEVLAKMQGAGVELTAIGYSFPRTMKVSRASREVTVGEVQDEIEQTLKERGRDVKIRSLDYRDTIHLNPGGVQLSVIDVSGPVAGKMTFTVLARSDDGEQRKLRITGDVDEWRELPVASRPLARGSVVSESDIALSRINISTLPSDAMRDLEGIVGQQLHQEVAYGQVFRRNALAIPAVIAQGARVTLVYDTGLLHATATGVALEAGARGQSIQVRNDSSKRVVPGKVLEPGLVGVMP